MVRYDLGEYLAKLLGSCPHPFEKTIHQLNIVTVTFLSLTYMCQPLMPIQASKTMHMPILYALHTQSVALGL